MGGETSHSTFHHVRCSELSLGNESSLAGSDQPSPLSPCQLSLTHSSQNEQNNAAHLPRFARFSARFLHLPFAALHPFSSPLVCWRCRWSCPFPLPGVTSASPAWPGTRLVQNRKKIQRGASRDLFQSHACRTKAGHSRSRKSKADTAAPAGP